MLDSIGKTKTFTMVDPFNPGNVVAGIIGVSKGNYGDLVFTEINGSSTEQVIHTTPKINYPFDRNGRWILPPATSIESYNKLDGTNIFMFKYNHQGQDYVSYKTRLQPFVQNGYFGNFQDMWRQMLDRYPNIPRLFTRNYYRANPSYWDITGYSFELYGSLNRHLIHYDTPLDTAMLFAMKDNKIVPLSEFKVSGATPCDGCAARNMATLCSRCTRYTDEIPMTSFTGVMGKPDYFEASYREAQDDLERRLEVVNADGKINSHGSEEFFAGSEGEIWYVELETGDYQMFKCKPESIENIHWESASPIIHKNTLRTTAFNAAESGELTLSAFKELLLEEFTEQKVYQSNDRIIKTFREVKDELNTRAYLRTLLEEIDYVNMELPDTMRKLAGLFRRDEMSQIYGMVKEMKEAYG